MKNKKAQALIAGIIASIVGVAMIPVLVSLIDDVQKTVVVDAEQITNTAFNSSITLANDDVVPGTETVINATAQVVEGDNRSTLVKGEEYGINYISGVVNFVNRTGTWNVSYTYEPTGYLDSAVGRTVVKNVTLMYIIGMIILILGVVGIFVATRN